MNRAELGFDRPRELEATGTPESRGTARDAVRLLVSDGTEDRHRRFQQLPEFLRPGDLLVVNESATLPAALDAATPHGRVRLHLSTEYGSGVWLVEMRKGVGEPGPVQASRGDWVRAGSLRGVLLAPYPSTPRLWFVRFDGDVRRVMGAAGEPIRYGYLRTRFDLRSYQTVFARVPGSAEMPSAARPFTPPIVADLARMGIRIAPILLHTAVSSLEVESERFEDHPILPEPYRVGRATVRAVESARERGGRIIAVGTSVVRALETAAASGSLAPSAGFTCLRLMPGAPIRVVDGLLTGFHDPYASHLALLHSLFGAARVRRAYAAAIQERYLWHEFGDSHLWLPDSHYAQGS